MVQSQLIFDRFKYAKISFSIALTLGLCSAYDIFFNRLTYCAQMNIWFNAQASKWISL